MQRTVCSLERRDVWLQGHHYDRRQHPIRRRAVRQARDERAVARPSVPFQSRSSSRTMTAMMSATIAMVRVFMRTSPRSVGTLIGVQGSRSIATMPDARADHAPMWGSYRHFVAELVETTLHLRLGRRCAAPIRALQHSGPGRSECSWQAKGAAVRATVSVRRSVRRYAPRASRLAR